MRFRYLQFNRNGLHHVLQHVHLRQPLKYTVLVMVFYKTVYFVYITWWNHRFAHKARNLPVKMRINGGGYSLLTLTSKLCFLRLRQKHTCLNICLLKVRIPVKACILVHLRLHLGPEITQKQIKLRSLRSFECENTSRWPKMQISR